MLRAHPERNHSMAALSVRQHLQHITEELPEEATWEDVIYQFELHASIERGLAQAKAGESITSEEFLAQLQAELRAVQ